MALNQAFDQAKGTEFLSPAVQSFRDAALGIIDPHTRVKNFADQTYIRALVSGDDDTVIAGIRVNLAGRNEGDGLSATARMVKQMMDMVAFQNTSEQIAQDLERLREIQEELGELRAEARAIEDRYLSVEDRTQQPDESDEEFLLRKKMALEASGAPQDEIDRWIEIKRLEAALEAEEAQIIQGLEAKDALDAAYYVLERDHAALIDKLGQLDTKIERNDNATDRLQQIKKMGAGEANIALDVLLVGHPDLDIDFPDGATVYERIDIAQQAIEEQSAELRVEQVDVTEEAQNIAEVKDGLESRLGDNLSELADYESVDYSDSVLSELNLDSDPSIAPNDPFSNSL